MDVDENPRVGGPRLGCLVAVGLLLALAPHFVWPESPQVIEVLADHDSRFKMAGMKDPVITVHAGAPVTLRVTAVKAKNHNRDGSIHGFSLLRAKDRSPVPGWDLLLKPGTQEFTLMAPAEPGEYVVVCTVVCSPDHDGMHMKFIVLP
jgi:heme/copper-type cytochrome/quinol oxidase subunit 2